MRKYVSLLASLLFVAPNMLPAQQQPALHWVPWSDAVFAQARQQHKFVLLDLEAVWCHWCHVMDDVTYKDPAVIRLLNAKYILIKVDQDARPDISNRYQDYGWPATVVFNANAGEIVKRQGYIPPRPMASMLQAIIDDPSPGPSIEKDSPISYAATSAFSAQTITQLNKNYDAQYDVAAGGWGFSHKYLDADSVEYALRLAAQGNALYQKRSQETLHNALKLLDPAWGGAYQYSVSGNWNEPHFEKLILIQAHFLREYSLAYAQSHLPEDLNAIQSVHGYVHNFLTDPASGAFYVSQDADLTDGEENESYFHMDDKGRRAKGMPRVDKHIYARENGWTIAALCQVYATTGNATALAQADRAATWIIANRGLAGFGFRHDEHDTAGPYLGDSLAMGQAMLALYAVTGERRWLDAAEQTRTFIAAHFAPAGRGGFLTAVATTQKPDRDENIALARFANLLAHYSGNAADHATAEQAMRFLATKQIALRPLSAGVLLAQNEFTSEPLHVTILGTHSDAQAIALHRTALAALSSYESLEWRDPTDKNPVPTDVTYPPLTHAAAFLCTATACSSPMTKPEELQAKITRALSAHK